MNVVIKRQNWIDWMKTIGIFLIIYGHLFSFAYMYIYTFSVPLFFFVSGYLCKIEANTHVFWKKIFYNLLVPMFLLAAICLTIDSVLDIWHGKFEIANVLLFFPRVLIGAHTGVGTLWFVYTLIILKIINQFIGNTPAVYLLIFLCLPIAGITLNICDPCWNGKSIIGSSIAILNVCVAAPFFLFGIWFKKYNLQQMFSDGNKEKLFVVMSLLLVYVCTKLNGEVWMYQNGYGRDFFLFLLGGCFGIYLVYFISRCLDRYKFKMVLAISKGTIIVLAFHTYLIKILVRRFFESPSLLDFVFAFLILIAFLPIIKFVEWKVPILMGKYRK